jgi:DMSO/TMAO reductase YedYZ molybdopterin-dependent catalytic subunit
VRPEPEGSPVGRRVVLSMLGLGAAGVVVGSKVQAKVADALRPITDHDPTGITGLIPGADRFRIYTVTGSLPSRSRADYRLSVRGLVERPVTLHYADLLEMPATSLHVDFQCVTGWRVQNVAWKGVKLADLLDHVGVDPKATHLRFTSFDGAYSESLSLSQARRPDVLVAYEMLGAPVTSAHGGPVRLFVAPMYGYKSCKWLDGIELTAGEQPGYWEGRGYSVDGWVGRSNGRDDPATSRQ